MSYYPQKFFLHFRSKISIAVITQNTDQHCYFGSMLPTENRILSPVGNLLPVWETLT